MLKELQTAHISLNKQADTLRKQNESLKLHQDRWDSAEVGGQDRCETRGFNDAVSTQWATWLMVWGRDDAPLLMTGQITLNPRTKVFISQQKSVLSLHTKVVRHELKKWRRSPLFIFERFYLIQRILSMIEMYDCPVTPLPQRHITYINKIVVLILFSSKSNTYCINWRHFSKCNFTLNYWTNI